MPTSRAAMRQLSVPEPAQGFDAGIRLAEASGAATEAADTTAAGARPGRRESADRAPQG